MSTFSSLQKRDRWKTDSDLEGSMTVHENVDHRDQQDVSSTTL